MIIKTCNNEDFDCCDRKYRNAILNTLLTLKPKFCLEIGTFLFQTSAVFAWYFQTRRIDGKLITADIAKWTRGGDPLNVYPVMVYPYEIDVESRHGGIEVYYKDYKEKLIKHDGLTLNLEIIQDKMDELSIDYFDFVFVDGDHSYLAIENDLIIAKVLCRPNGYILIDDVMDNYHDGQVKFYNELKRTGNTFYEFEDWEISPQIALIKNKDLKL